MSDNEEKHSTSASWDSEVAKNTPRISHNKPAKPREASSMRVDMGFRWPLIELKARSVTMIRVLKHDTKMDSGTKRVKSEEANTVRKFAARARHIMPKMITVT